MTGTPAAHIDGIRLTRRQAIAAALTVAAAAPIGLANGSSASAAPVPAQLVLPRPTGPYPVGTVPLHLIDGSRPGLRRELMISIWYPAQHVDRHPPAPWMPPAVLAALLASAGFAADIAAAPLTAGHEGAPVRHTIGRLPVIMYSHGAHGHRAENTIVVQELASHGYAVVTVDHTDDAFSQFPDGRVIVPLQDPERALGPADFAADIRFVLDRIVELAAGVNPDAAHRPLPANLCGALDLNRIGMFGWSKGATATVLVMNADRRIQAGLAIDGPMQPAITADLNRPFLLLTAAFTRAEPSVAQLWSHLRGWRRNLQATGAVHSSYSDYQALMPQLAVVAGMRDDELRDWIGTLDPARAVRIQQAYPLAFFDLHLRRRRQHLLDGPNPAFPDVMFVP
ncbi:alpha/beta hydrolase family protein [Dactylosporangium sp. NPDC051541]|uniref:alpha/beta hydrolase family protein n=1 Tax=Dactylosporangium sp. NPDC051541 TaxID=3363977 RepID=UPI0037A3E3AF